MGTQVFSYCYALMSVKFEENSTLTSISHGAFYNCSFLPSIDIPNSVRTIDGYAFAFCYALRAVTFEENSKLTNINEYAFYTCTSLETIILPDSLKIIDEWCFSECSSLTSIYISDSVATIENYAFFSCSNLTIYCEAPSKPSGWLDNWYSSDRPVVWNSYKGIQGSLNGLEYAACYDTEGNPYIIITGYNGSNTDVVIPEYIEVNGEDIVVKEISEDAFSGQTNIVSVTISDSVTIIGDSAFEGCKNLGTVNIGENSQLISIGNDAFFNCSSLTSIYIPDSVTIIGGNVFYGCSNLTIYCEASSRPSGWVSFWNNSNRPVVWNCTYDEYLETIA